MGHNKSEQDANKADGSQHHRSPPAIITIIQLNTDNRLSNNSNNINSDDRMRRVRRTSSHVGNGKSQVAINNNSKPKSFYSNQNQQHFVSHSSKEDLTSLRPHLSSPSLSIQLSLPTVGPIGNNSKVKIQNLEEDDADLLVIDNIQKELENKVEFYLI